NKFIYLIGDPSHGDIVIIQRPHKNYVKRVIALPGETVEVINHILYIDGEEANSFVSEEASLHTGNFGPVEVPEDSYFGMGDHCAISKNSRIGLVLMDGDDIVGKSELMVNPFSDWGVPRYKSEVSLAFMYINTLPFSLPYLKCNTRYSMPGYQNKQYQKLFPTYAAPSLLLFI